MNTLLIIRGEIACLIILLLLHINERSYDTGKDHRSFTRLFIFALGHLIFDIITVITVNHLDTVPAWLNKGFHIVFYFTAMLFANELLNYIIALYYGGRGLKRIYRLTLLPFVIYLIALPFLPMTFRSGRGTNYSFGPALFIGYGMAMVYFVAGLLLILVHFKESPQSVRRALLPMMIVIITMELIQIIVPEFLFTGSTVTIITVAFFFSLENPADVFRQKAWIDALTGVDSRHSYEMTMNRLEKSYARNPKQRFALVFCDINCLKAVNNLYGHNEGDRYISTVAQILMRELKGAEKIFRMGGDEFLALYNEADEATVKREIENVRLACERESQTRDYTVAAAIGYALSGGNYGSVKEILRVADYLMYKNKAEIKERKAYMPDKLKLNLTGLTDRMFEAFAGTSERNYIFMCNMETNVSRLSPSMAEYFGLPGEFIYDFLTVWKEYVHPDDRDILTKDVGLLFNGAQDSHDMEYRALNRDGEYVVLRCQGRILHGKDGEPDLFGGTIVNHGILETSDPVTGLPNERAYSERMQDIVTHREGAVLLKFGITTFSRINMLYGYPNGNEVLCAFCGCVKQILRGKGQLYRIDGTEFAAILPLMTEEEARAIFRRIRHAAANEIRVELRTIPLKLSAGALILSGNYESSASAVRAALIYAHEQSRYEQNGHMVFYNPPGETEDIQDVKLLALIHRDALGPRAGFHLVYQPIAHINSTEPVGAEALLRWRSDAYGVVMPGRFIPWLENDPCFFDLGAWILESALREMRPVVDKKPDFTLNVNITIQQLQNEDFRETVLGALKATGFPAKNLCLELNERCRELDPAFLRSEIEAFHEKGLRVALDDVGTGSASFGLLLKLPLDEIKIDMSIVSGIRDQKPNQILAKSVVDASDTLKFDICFEGIEDEKTYEYLKRYPGCFYQGFYYARPMPAEELIKRIE